MVFVDVADADGTADLWDIVQASFPLGAGDVADVVFLLHHVDALPVATIALVRTLLSRHAGAIVITTSSQLLGLEEELCLEVLPLDGDEGVALLRGEMKRLGIRRTDDGNDDDDDDEQGLRGIVAAVDGHPLCLIRAAACLRLRSPAGLLAALTDEDNAVAVLEAGGPISEHFVDALARLPHRAREVLGAVGTFAEACRVVDVERVLAAATEKHDKHDKHEAVEGPRPDSNDGDSDVFRALLFLRERSLLHPVDGDRFRLLSPVRDVVRHAVIGASRERTTRGAALVTPALTRAHAAVQVGLAQRIVAAFLMRGALPDPVINQEARDADDDFARASQQLALDSSISETSIWRGRTLLVMARGLVGLVPPADALVALDALLLARPERTLDDVRHPDDEHVHADELAAVSLVRQRLLRALGRHQEAAADGDVFRAIPGVSLPLRAFHEVMAGIDARSRGQIATAQAFHDDAAAILAVDDVPPRLLAMNTACLGRLACDTGDVEEAFSLNQEAVSMFDRLGETWLAGLGLANLAQLQQGEGHLDDAWSLLSRALKRLETGSFGHYRAIYQAIAAALHVEAGQLTEARRAVDAALAVLDDDALPAAHVHVHGIAALVRSIEHPGIHDNDALEHLEQCRQAAARANDDVTRLQARLFAGAVDVAQQSPERGEALRRRWQAACEVLTTGGDPDSTLVDAVDVVVAPTHLDTRCGVRLLLQQIHAADQRATSRGNISSTLLESSISTRPAACHLRVGPAGQWFAVDDHVPVDLRRRGAMRRILTALVERRHDAVDEALSASSLVAAGWPDERIQSEAASLRLRVAIASLRKLGLRGVLLTRDDGYLLAPEVALF